MHRHMQVRLLSDEETGRPGGGFELFDTVKQTHTRMAALTDTSRADSHRGSGSMKSYELDNAKWEVLLREAALGFPSHQRVRACRALR